MGAGVLVGFRGVFGVEGGMGHGGGMEGAWPRYGSPECVGGGGVLGFGRPRGLLGLKGVDELGAGGFLS